MTIETGNPFSGERLQQIKQFLEAQELRYEEPVDYTVLLLDEEKIIGTGSANRNVLKCLAVDPAYRGQNLLGQILTELTMHFYSEGITHYFGFTKPKNDYLFLSMGLYEVVRTEDVLLLENRRDGLSKYLKKIGKETEQTKESAAPGKGDAIGCIVAHANPFTLGHRYLIEKASEECRWLHVFILSESGSEIPAEDRYRLVQEGTKDLSNVILHKASDYLVSPATFPTYFIKEQARADEINCGLDVKLFGSRIAPVLGITRRYLGTEPNCGVTSAYNEILKRELPNYGVEVREIERMQINEEPISASKVREACMMADWGKIEKSVPPATLQYLKKHFSGV